jgi:hypothetical protein
LFPQHLSLQDWKSFHQMSLKVVVGEGEMRITSKLDGEPPITRVVRDDEIWACASRVDVGRCGEERFVRIMEDRGVFRFTWVDDSGFAVFKDVPMDRVRGLRFVPLR